MAGVSATSDADERIGRAMAVRADAWPQATTIRTDTLPDASVERAVGLVRAARGDHP